MPCGGKKPKMKSIIDYIIPYIRAESSDITKKRKVYDLDTEVQNFIKNETGKDRLTAMYTIERGQPLHPYLGYIFDTCKLVGVTVFFFGSALGARKADEKFVQKSKQRKWSSKLQASRAYLDAQILGGARIGAVWGVKCVAFTGTFLLVSQTLAVYKNRTSILDFTAGGCVSGISARMTYGVRGIIVGGTIGAVLGVMAGAFATVLLNTSNQTQEHRHYQMIYSRLKEKREQDELLRGSRN